MSNLLDTIHNPQDLKRISLEKFPDLAEEIRNRIIETVSKNGGHLASNLGVVELTLVLHYVFDTPKDKIVWDVGHQTYTHKLITGRRERFHTIRQYKGISGFPRVEESPYDVFNVGHGGTSISVALSLAYARDIRKENHHVLAVIGDGSLTSGLALEGLNNSGDYKNNLIVILNDNKMSISKNVGAFSAYLNRIITGQLYNKMKHETELILKNVPRIGRQVWQFAGKIEEAVKGLLTPGRIFEDLGFNYVGPVQGHSIPELIHTFESIKKLKGPILVHVVTEKGKGYNHAEKKQPFFHGIGPFDILTGEPKKNNGPPTYTEIFGQTLVKLAKQDERIIAITAAMTDGTGLDKFAREFPGRFVDVGMAEQHAVTFAAGLAQQGFKPVVAVYSTFIQRAYDEILHDVCLTKLPVIFALDRAGIVGEDGPTHQGVFDFSFLRSIPELVIMAPKDENELQHMLCTATNYFGPIVLRYPRGSGEGGVLDKKLFPIDIGRGELLRKGDELLILAIGNMVCQSLKAAKKLSLEGIEASVINARFVKPLDRNLIVSVVLKIKKILIVEENALPGGFGSAVLEMLEEEKIRDVSIARLGLPDHFIEHGGQAILRKKYGLDEEGIYLKSKELIGQTKKSFFSALINA